MAGTRKFAAAVTAGRLAKAVEFFDSAEHLQAGRTGRCVRRPTTLNTEKQRPPDLPGNAAAMARSHPASLLSYAKKGFHRAAELDNHRISATILRRGNFNTHPTLGHVVFVNVGLLDAVEANTHVAAQHLFAIKRAAWVNRELIWRKFGDLILGHDGFR